MNEVKLLCLKLRRLLHSRGFNRDDTDDLIQEAFLRLQQYRREQTVKHNEAFLVRTALNLLSDWRKKARVAATVPNALETLPLADPAPALDAILDAQNRLRHFEAGLRHLSPRRREVFILHRIDGYTFAQIANKLGITVSMVEKHAAWAMLNLGDWMAQLDDPHAGACNEDRQKTLP